MRRLTDQDYELLSAYLDGALSDSERSALESRLQNEPDLRRELEGLRQTVTLVRELPKLKAPRDFTLTNAMVRATSQRLLIFPTTTMFSALSAAAAVLLLVLGGVFLLQNNQVAAPMPIASIQEQTVQDIAAVPSATLTETRELDTGSQRASTESPTANPSPVEPETAAQTEPFPPAPADGSDAAAGLYAATQEISLSQSYAPPQPAGSPAEPNQAGEAAAADEAQDDFNTDELQDSQAATTSEVGSPALTFAATPSLESPAANEVSAADNRPELEATATFLSEQFAVSQEEQTAATSTLSQTAAPVANETAPKQPGDNSLTLASVLFVAGVALLLISAATTWVRWRRS